MKRHWILFLGNHRTTEKQVLPGLTRYYNVVVAQTRREALGLLCQQSLDLVLVDVASIRFDLERFCCDFREQSSTILFFFLLSKGMRLEQFPRANGYLRHPFNERQLQRRLIRILPQEPGDLLAWEGLQLDVMGRLLIWEAEQAPITPKLAALLQAFLRAPQVVLSRANLMQNVWGTDYLGDTRTLDVHIHALRALLMQLHVPFSLQTVRRQGYMLVARSESEADLELPQRAEE